MKNREEVLKNLLELSKRGVGGEAVNAENLLNKLLKKYNMTIEDIETGEELKHRDFIFNDPWEEKLLNQLYYSMYPDRQTYSYTYRRTKAHRQTLIVELTDAEFIEFTYAYDVYKESWKHELELFYHAFISTNNLFPKNPPKNTGAKDISDVMSYGDRMRMSMMASGIQSAQVRKAIGTGEN